MNALSSEELRVARAAAADPVPLRTAAPEQRRPWPSLWALVAKREVRQYLVILTVFWVYVACSNVLYASSMQASIAGLGGKHMFAPYCARLVQHSTN